MPEIIQSAWWIVYYLSDEGPRYLLIKRHAKSGKIERVAPKGKLEQGESTESAALREIWEETGLPINHLIVKQKVWVTQLRSSDGYGTLNKDVTYFLVEYTGEPDSVKIIEGEWYIGIYMRASIKTVIELLYYPDMRELIRSAHMSLTKQDKKSQIKESFMKKLD